MLIGVAERLSGQLDPRVGEKLSVSAPNPHANQRPSYPTSLQHSRERHRANEALRPEDSEAGGPHHSERKAACLRKAGRIGDPGGRDGSREGSNRPRTNRELGA